MNKKNNINLKLHKFENNYKNELSITNKKLLEYLKSYDIINFNKSYSTKIVAISNYKNSNQDIFNYIFSGTIKRSLILLDKNLNKNLNIHINNISFNGKAILELKKLDLIYTNEYNKLLYIFFYFIPFSRRIIVMLQKNEYNFFSFKKSDNQQYGLIFNNFYNITNHHITSHGFNMERLVNYTRLKDNINFLYENYEHKYLDILKKNRKYYVKNRVYTNNSNTNNNNNSNSKEFDLLRTECDMNETNPICNIKIKSIKYVEINIPFIEIKDDFFIDNKLKNMYDLYKYSSYYKILFYMINNEINTNVYSLLNINNDKDYYVASLNTFIDKQYITHLLDIMSYCLFLLNNQESFHDIEKKKYTIILFYYIFIFMMPFSLGTASIAEISLFTLWNKYMDINIIKNEYIMLDIEALSLPYDIFYKNCFNNDGTKYTPYLFI
jgi:hypothetical protein